MGRVGVIRVSVAGRLHPKDDSIRLSVPVFVSVGPVQLEFKHLFGSMAPARPFNINVCVLSATTHHETLGRSVGLSPGVGNPVALGVSCALLSPLALVWCPKSWQHVE